MMETGGNPAQFFPCTKWITSPFKQTNKVASTQISSYVTCLDHHKMADERSTPLKDMNEEETMKTVVVNL